MLARLALIVALAASAPWPLLAQDLGLVGPLRIRDVSPLSLFRLDMPPAHGVNAIERGWGIELGYVHSNLYLVSKTAEAWLQQRGRREHLTQAEAEALLEESGDVFLFDGEVSVVNMTVGYAFSPRWQAMVTVPYHSYGGGFLDRPIENFHEAVGLGHDGRPYLPPNSIHVVARLGDQQQVIVTDDGSSGLGDAVLTLRYNRELSENFFGVLEGAARLPTGKEHLYFSKDDPEFGLQTSLQYQKGIHGYYASLSYIWVADEPFFPEVSDTPTLMLGFERRLSDAVTSVLLQGTWSQSTIRGVERSDLTKARMQVSLGLRRQIGRFSTSIALTENIIHLNNTPDIGIHVGMAWILPD
jgi:hypothetical protein